MENRPPPEDISTREPGKGMVGGLEMGCGRFAEWGLAEGGAGWFSGRRDIVVSSSGSMKIRTSNVKNTAKRPPLNLQNPAIGLL